MVTQIKSAGLNLLAERSLRLSDEVRNSSSPPVLRTLETIKSCLVGNDEEAVQSGLKAIDSLARTMVPGEENAFAVLVPDILPHIHHRSNNENATDALSTIWYVSRTEMVLMLPTIRKHETWSTDYP